MPFAPAVSALLLALAADTTPLRISYDAPAACPAEDALYDAVQARTDHVHRAVNDERAVEVSVRVTHTEHGFVGEVRETVNQSESSARTMTGETCKEVVEALSLTIALSVDPNAHTPVPAPEPAKLTVCPPSAETPKVAATVTAPTESPVAVELGLGVLATEFLSSDFSVGSALSGTLLRHVSATRSASLELSLLFATTSLVDSPATHEADFAGVALDACPVRWASERLEWAPCLLGSAGVLDITGRSVSTPATVQRSFVTAGVDAQLSVLLGHGFVFESALGASVPLVKRRFYLAEPERVVAETPTVSPLLRAGLGFRF